MNDEFRCLKFILVFINELHICRDHIIEMDSGFKQFV